MVVVVGVFSVVEVAVVTVAVVVAVAVVFLPAGEMMAALVALGCAPNQIQIF